MMVYKFRAICNDAGYGNEEYYLKMIYSYSINQIAFEDEVDEVRLLVDGKWLKVKSETVGLYTGLNDKNGTEIYEGDSVNVKIPDVITRKGYIVNTNVHVTSENGMYGFKYGIRGEFSTFRDFIKETEFMVIGNIHQNPELLEGRG